MATITAGRQIQDRDSIGGIKSVYIITVSNVAQLLTESNTTLDANHVVTDFGSGFSSNCKAIRFDVLRGAGGFTQSVEGSIENGTYSFNQTVEFTLHKIDAAMQKLINDLAKTRTTLCIHDNNDNVIFAGYGNGMEMVGGSFQTGNGFGELNGATLTFEGRETKPAPFLTAAAGSGTANYPFDGIATADNEPVPGFS